VSAIIGLNENQRFPIINMDSEAAWEFNESMRASRDRMIEERAEDVTCDFNFALHNMEGRYAAFGGILSLITRRVYDTGDTYGIHNIYIETGERITSRDLLELVGYGAPEALLESLRGKVEHYYRGLPEGYPFTIHLHKALLELETIDWLALYINEKGRVFWVTSLPFMGGAEFHSVLIDPEMPDELFFPENTELLRHWEMLG